MDLTATWLEDTDAKTREVYFGLIREMPPGKRLARVFELCNFQESLQRGSVRKMYPNADEREVFLRVAARRLDRETMIRLYQWDPDLHT